MYYCTACDVKWADPDDPETAGIYAKCTEARHRTWDFEAKLFKAGPAEAGQSPHP